MVELIRDISLITISAIGSFGLVVLYSKVFFISKEIKRINKEIEEKQIKLDKHEIDNIGPFGDIDITGDRQRHRRSLEQEIQRLQERKKCLVEEISIYKIFKK